ncbi:MAG: cytochrome b/b6 domain-containing protein [Gammaproteobacteria bacterium]|nr:cytochrome b/b6 domain-containing protein [Gammaproteobacteria bacterium]
MSLQATGQQVKVWDGFVRFFHWSLVLSFIAAYLTFQFGMQETHAILGYFITGLIIFRIIWGFAGSQYARFSNFIYRPKTVIDYIKSIYSGQPAHYLGHNPAGGMMVLALLTALTIITVSGLVILGTIEFDGPLVGVLHNLGDETVYAFREIHEVCVNVMLALIAFHVVGVILASVQHKENLVKAMLTGYKQHFGH